MLASHGGVAYIYILVQARLALCLGAAGRRRCHPVDHLLCHTIIFVYYFPVVMCAKIFPESLIWTDWKLVCRVGRGGWVGAFLAPFPDGPTTNLIVNEAH